MTTLGPTILIFFGLLQANPNTGVLMDNAQTFPTLEACQTKLYTLLPELKTAFPDRTITGQCIEVNSGRERSGKGKMR